MRYNTFCVRLHRHKHTHILCAGATLKLVCNSVTNTFFLTTRANSHGSFIFRVLSFDFKRYNVLKECAIFLDAADPIHKCSQPTNINFGRSGALLRARKPSRFTVAPLAFAPLPCAIPLPGLRDQQPTNNRPLIAFQPLPPPTKKSKPPAPLPPPTKQKAPAPLPAPPTKKSKPPAP